MNQDRLLLNGFYIVAVGSIGWFGWSGFKEYGESQSQQIGGAPVDSAVTAAQPPDGAYQGTLGDLPDVAKAVLDFTPADNRNQVNSDSIRDRVENACGLNDYVGSTDFPGIIRVSPPGAHGWVRVTSKPGKCGGAGGAIYGNDPTLNFELSADQEHIRDVADSADSPSSSDNAAYFLTH